jgi:hypothetical protein
MVVASDFVLGRRECLGVGIETDDFDTRILAFHHCSQCARATRDFERALPGLKGGVVNERSAGCISTEELHEGS